MQVAPQFKEWATAFPSLGGEPLHVDAYLSERRFQLEKREIFRKSWLCIGHVSELPEAGGFLVRDVEVWDTQLVAIRGDDGVVRAFHNVCSHRGMLVAQGDAEGKGRCKGGRLRCGFHAWTYGTKGELTWIPDEENFHGLDRSKLGLTPVATEVFNTLIFVAIDPEQGLRDSLGGMAEQLGEDSLEGYELFRRYDVLEKCNWKVSVDAQNEGYHVSTQHSQSMPGVFVTNKQGSTRHQKMDFFGRHQLTGVSNSPTYKPTELEKMMYGLNGASGGLREQTRESSFEFNFVYPNFAVLMFDTGFGVQITTETFWPLAVDRTLWEIRSYYKPAANVEQFLQQDMFAVVNRIVMDEDGSGHEATQKGLASRVKSHVHFQDEEIGCRKFHVDVAEQIGAPFASGDAA